jgi:hypothetical protein
LKPGILCGACLGFVLIAPGARAEGTTPALEGADSTRPGAVIVTLRGTQAGLRYRLFAGDEDRPLAACGEGCRIRLPQGRYRLQVAGPPGGDVRTSEQTVDVFEDSVLRVDPPSSSSRSTGLAVGITGASLLVVGGVVLYVGLIAEFVTYVRNDQTCTTNVETGQVSCVSTHHGTNWAIWTGAGMMVAGAIMTPIGWVTFAHNNRPRIEVMSPGRRASEAGLWRLGPTRIGTGWGLGSTLSF